jgi:hypothetical protein
MSSEIAIRPKASQQLATITGMEPSVMLDVIKAQCFKGNPANVSNEQLAAFVSIAAEMGVNPLLPGMIYAYPIQGGGITPMVGPDGVFKKLTEHPSVESWETTVYPEDITLPPTHAVTKIWRKGSDKPLTKTCLLSEWKVDSNPNWRTRPRHQLEIRTLKQCARQIIHGVPFDEDERIIMGEINVTPTAAEGEAAANTAAATRAKVPKKEPKGAAAVAENAKKPETIEAEVVTEKPAPKAETPAEKLPPPPPNPVTEPTPANENPAPAQPRAFLKHDEEITATVTVHELSVMFASWPAPNTPTVSAIVKGDFNGQVVHFNGAAAKDDKLTPLAPWQPGAIVTVWLKGRINNKTGKVMAMVTKAEAATAVAALDVE